MRSIAIGALSALWIFCVERTAAAFPSAVVFAPTGTVNEEGELDTYAMYLRDMREAAPWQVWIGAQAGLWGGVKLEGGRFFAVEAGADFMIDAADGARITPLANAKISIVDRRGARPAVALALYQVSSTGASSASLAYLSLTNGVHAGGVPLGDVTLGAFTSLAASERTDRCSDACAFRGGFPMEDSRYGVLAGWSSPAFGPVRFAVDVVTGTSTASGLNAVASIEVIRGVRPFVGLSLAADRRRELEPTDVAFVGIAFGLAPKSQGRP